MLTYRNTSFAPQTAFPGRTLTFDFPALQTGVAEYAQGPTGCTVFSFPKGAQTAIDKRGGAVGITGEYPWNHAIVLAGGSPEQIAQDLTGVQQLKVDEVFFSDQASPTIDETVQRLEEIQTIVCR